MSRRFQKKIVYVATGAYQGRPGSQQSKVFEAVRVAGPRGTTKDEVYRAINQGAPTDIVPERNVAYYLKALTNAGALSALGAPTPAQRPTSAAVQMNQIQALEAQFLDVFERLLVAKAKAGGLNADADDAYAAYNKMKPAYLGRLTATDGGTVNEKKTAFRFAAINAIKALF